MPGWLVGSFAENHPRGLNKVVTMTLLQYCFEMDESTSTFSTHTPVRAQTSFPLAVVKAWRVRYGAVLGVSYHPIMEGLEGLQHCKVYRSDCVIATNGRMSRDDRSLQEKNR